MEASKQRMIGSLRRDVFKQLHKKGEPWFYACDLDFCLVSKEPPGIVACLDVKRSCEPVTFAEVLAYNTVLLLGVPVYIVRVQDPKDGPFTVQQYVSGDWKPEPPVVRYGPPRRYPTWEAFFEWERELRNAYTKAVQEPTP